MLLIKRTRNRPQSTDLAEKTRYEETPTVIRFQALIAHGIFFMPRF